MPLTETESDGPGPYYRIGLRLAFPAGQDASLSGLHRETRCSDRRFLPVTAELGNVFNNQVFSGERVGTAWIGSIEVIPRTIPRIIARILCQRFISQRVSHRCPRLYPIAGQSAMYKNPYTHLTPRNHFHTPVPRRTLTPKLCSLARDINSSVVKL